MADLASILKQKFFRDVVADLLMRNRSDRKQFDHTLVEATFRQQVLPCLGELAGITLEDLLEVWRRISDRDPSDATAACQEFTNALVAESSRCWLSDPIAVGPPARWFYFGRAEFDDEFWRSDDARFGALFLGQMPSGGKREWVGEKVNGVNERLYIAVRGKCSRRFFDEFCDLVSSAVSTLLRVVRDLWEEKVVEFLTDPRDSPQDTLEMAWDDVDAILDFTGPRAWTVRIAGDGSVTDEPTRRLAYDSREFVGDAVSAFFAEVSPKKEPMALRIKNAVRLIAESDNQRHDPIGLAMSVTAIEALLYRRSDNVTQTFAENIAFLLEPEPMHRLEAEKWGKGIYDLRSGVLHGTDLNCSAEDIRKAKLAAGMVLRAMLERRAAMKRVGDENEDIGKFFEELRSGKYRPGQLTHVSDLPLKRFWRAHSPKGNG